MPRVARSTSRGSLARPASRGRLEGSASRGRLEGSASRGSPARQCRPPTAAAAAKEKQGPPPERGGWGLPGAARDRLHPGRGTSPSLSAHLQAVRPRSERSPPQARSHAPSQVVGMRHHVQLSRSAQVCGYSWSPPDALFPNHQQRGGHQDPHRWRGRAQHPVRGDVQQPPSALQPASANQALLRYH